MELYTGLMEGACSILDRMRGAFSREDSFGWFATSVVGMMSRTDTLGLTSVVRALGLDGDRSYESLVHSYRSEAWDSAGACGAWLAAVGAEAPLVRRRGRVLLPVDGVKVCKEGSRMPGVKRQHQESSDSGKPEYMFGHLFGCVGALAAAPGGAAFCVPLRRGLQDGMRAAAAWEGSPFPGESHVVAAMDLAFWAAGGLGPAYALMDRYFLAKTALARLSELNGGGGEPLVHLVTKAKSNCVAYEEPPERPAGSRGRPPKRGARVELASLFSDGAEFERGTASLSGEEVPIEYLVRDLLWGAGLYAPMRFVLVRCRGHETVLATTDRSLSAAEVVELYAARYGIECSFRAMKCDVGAFSYRFWTLACPELDRFARSGSPDPLASVSSPRDRERVLACAEACARFVAVCCAATGIAQILACGHEVGGDLDSLSYKRTRGRAAKVSERTVLDVFRSRAREWLFSCKGPGPSGRIAGFIRSKTASARLARDGRWDK